jgi:chromate reductase
MKWLLISGSFREKSFNTQLEIMVRDIWQTKADITMLHYDDVPLFNQDKEFPTPDAVKAVRQAAQEADGIWFFCPEYNGQVPGVLKNLLDWLSRAPIEGGAPDTSAVYGKAATVSGAGGRFGASRAAAQLNELLVNMGMHVMDTPELHVTLTPEEWITNYIILSEQQLETLKAQGADFLTFTEDKPWQKK